jgi:methionyl-tRNA formyltransferase
LPLLLIAHHSSPITPNPMTALTIVFGGTPDFAVPALEALLGAGHRVAAVYTQPDRPAGRGRHVTQSAVKQTALRHGLTIEQPATLRDAGAAAHLASYRPDVMVVVAYGLLLPKAILDTPKFGCINIHGSILPRWRGAAPIQRALLAGDGETGVSIMRMDVGLDTGPVLATATTPIGAHDTAAILHDRLAMLGAHALIETLPKFASGDLIPEPQQEVGVTYAHKLRKEEATIDWTRSALEIDRQVRAFNPWPVAETHWRGQQLRVWECVAVDVRVDARPGSALSADANGIVVATGLGALNLTRVQLAGRKQMSAAEFLNAHRIVGDVLGLAAHESPQ